jgi:hypothetical protein
LPSTIGTSLDTGAKWVLEQTGIAPTVVEALSNFEPGIANQAWGQAQQIYQQVSQGNFNLTDIPFALQDLQNLERLGRNIFYPSTAEQRSIAVCEGISPYAIDLILRAPKYKFLFVVQVTFNEAYSGMQKLDFAFVIKNTTRPNLKYQMSDINYYNFRTRHVTRTEFDEMKMSFHEDTGTGRSNTPSALAQAAGEQGNSALRFYNTYMRATVPITNYATHGELSDIEQKGMDFAAMNQPVPVDADTHAYKYAASSGPLMSSRAYSDPRNIIPEIRLFHVYNYGKSMNVYKFFNPRITSLSLDDLDMANSTEGTEVSMTFNFDSVYIDTGVPMNTQEYNLAELQAGGKYPLRYNATAGGMPLPERNIAPFGTPSNGTGDSCDPAINTKLPPVDDTSFI